MVSVNPSGSGSVRKNPDKPTYSYGEQVTLSATANSGYTLSSWSGDVSGKTDSVALTINGNEAVTANFTASSETVSIPTTPTGSAGSAAGSPCSYSTGGARSSLGHAVQYQFDWKGDGSDLSNWGSATQSKTWTVPGTYYVRARARCSRDVSVVSGWSGSLSVSISVPDISIAPNAYDFGNVKVKRRKTASFKIKNNGPADLSISTVIRGTNASMFTITSGGGSRTIKPRRTLTIWVAFKPITTGEKVSTLSITSNDPETATVGIPLRGTGQ
jgi:hypothetical protein